MSRVRSSVEARAPAVAAGGAAAACLGIAAEWPFVPAADVVFVGVWVLIACFGALLTRRSPPRDIGPAFLVTGAIFCSSVLAHGWAVRASLLEPGLPLAPPAVWLATWLGSLAIGLLPLILLAIPTGDIPRRLGMMVVVAAVAVAAAQSVAESPLEGVHETLPAIPNPLGVASLAPLVGLLTTVGVVALIVVTLIAIWRMVASTRRSLTSGVQLRWVVAATLLGPATFIVSFAVEVAGAVPVSNAIAAIGYALAVTLLISAVAASTARHRPYAIESLVDRAVVFAALTALGAVVYSVVVASATLVLSDGAFTGASLVATALVAVGFSSAYRQVRPWTRRWLFGQHTEPYEVLAALGARLESAIGTGEVLPALVNALQEALDSTGVAIDLREGDGFSTAASTAEPVVAVVTTPVVAAGEVVGRLRVAARRNGAPFDEVDRRLLDDVARQAAVAIQTLRLLLDLQRSRAAAVQGREEERRRLQRDLHDGLGPALAGLVLEAESARRLLSTSPDDARTALDEVVEQLKSATTEVRRVTRGMRPAVLDQLGLVGALRERVASLTADGRLTIEIEAEQDIRFPAAVEVATYHIVCEALTNVVRHSSATHCRVAIENNGAVEIHVYDDGVGVGDSHLPGVGIRSMQERATELGGTLTVGQSGTHGGTRVRARIPLS